MSTTVKTYQFFNQDRLGGDSACESQRTAQNIRYDSYLHTAYFQQQPEEQIRFATSLPAMVPNGLSHGLGLSSAVIDADSSLLIKSSQERNLGRLQLLERPFMTVPYLGRGSCDPTVESQLMQGEAITDKKSASTIMSQSFMGYTMRPADAKLDQRAMDPKYSVEEAALQGWTRGGTDTRFKPEDTYRGSKAY